MFKWSLENELKLATAILAIHPAKVSQAECELLAALMGDGCTAKAITHRIGKFRDTASKLNLPDVSATPATPSPGTKRGRKPQVQGKGGGAAESPTKKPRKTKAKTALESVDQDEDGPVGVGKEKLRNDEVQVSKEEVSETEAETPIAVKNDV